MCLISALSFHGITTQVPRAVYLARVDRAWRRLRKWADLQNFRFHDLRHHFSSRLVQSGVPLNTVRELLGHSDTAMVLRYAHLSPDHFADVVEKVARPKEGQAAVTNGNCVRDTQDIHSRAIPPNQGLFPNNLI